MSALLPAQQSSHGLARAVNQSTAELLVSGGDSRLVPESATGLTKYGTSSRPWDDVCGLGSCSASTISRFAYNVCRQVHRELHSLGEGAALGHGLGRQYEQVRCEIWQLLTCGSVSTVDVAVTPSGTDAELLALALCHGDLSKRVLNIVVGPQEVGSGTLHAAAGCYFDRLVPNHGLDREPAFRVGDPVDERISDRTEVATIWLRDVDGRPRPIEEVDDEALRWVEQAVSEGRRALLHIVAHSKSGLWAPSWSSVSRLHDRFRDQVLVMVDAAQGRLRRRHLQSALRRGWLVLTTGSKFYGGPPFCGALLVPSALQPRWLGVDRFPPAWGQFFTADQLPQTWGALRASLPPTGNPGLAVRWHAAIAEMQAYYRTRGISRFRALRAFQSSVQKAFHGSESITLAKPADNRLTVCPESDSLETLFAISLHRGRSIADQLGVNELREVHRWLYHDLSACVGRHSWVHETQHAGSPGSPRQNGWRDVSESELRAILAARFHLGQPVSLGRDPSRGSSQLRIALSGPLQASQEQRPNESGVAYGVEEMQSCMPLLRRKIEWLIDHLSFLRGTVEGGASEAVRV